MASQSKSGIPALALIALVLSGCLSGAEPRETAATSGAPVPGTGVIAASHPLAVEAGAEMLRRGGNAVDAAAAVQFALNVVEPEMSGIGGGAFLLIYDPDTRQTVILDGREMAPADATPDLFQGRPSDEVRESQGYSVGVPGTLKAFETALARFGTLTLGETMQPAIGIAENGFLVDRYLELNIATGSQELLSWPASARIYFSNVICPQERAPTASEKLSCTGTPRREGDRLSNPDLAKTFRLLSASGTGAFYDGEIGKAIIATTSQRHGRMTLADLGNYVVKERSPIRGTYHGYEVFGVPPPSAGGITVQQVLSLIEPLELEAKGHNSVDSLHPLLEAMHLTYADRYAYLGDADFVPVPVRGLLHPDYIAERRKLIDPGKALPAKAGDPWKYENASAKDEPAESADPDPKSHTTHFVVRDGSGMIVSVTSTIESGWGTGMTVPGYGFLLNDEMTDFSYAPSGPNQVGPGKRPLSSMSPTLVLRDGEPVLVLGSPGGQTIPQAVLQVLLGALDHEKPLSDAVAAARVWSPRYSPPGPGAPYVSTLGVIWDRDLSRETREGLKARGHAVDEFPDPIGIGNVQALQRTASGDWIGVADTRHAQGAVTYVPASEMRTPTGE